MCNNGACTKCKPNRACHRWPLQLALELSVMGAGLIDKITRSRWAVQVLHFSTSYGAFRWAAHTFLSCHAVHARIRTKPTHLTGGDKN